MGVIKINNIIYGSNNSADIIYKDTTVEEKLNSIPVFDPSDNTNIEANQYDYLTYGHIIDNLNSSDTNQVLSANQGRVLSEKIDNIDLSYLETAISENDVAIESLNTSVNLINNEINNIKDEKASVNSVIDLSNSLNKIKTTVITYNNEDDYLYINGNKWKLAGLISHALIPTLSSNTGLNGYVVYVSQYAGSDAYPWKAFDNDSNTYAYGVNSGATAAYLGYMFNNRYNVKKVEFLYFNPSSSSHTITTKLQCYDGVNWIDIPNTTYTHKYAGSENKNFTYEIDDLNTYGIRVYATNTASFVISLRDMQVYGYE